jgi:hypothetical protein
VGKQCGHGECSAVDHTDCMCMGRGGGRAFIGRGLCGRVEWACVGGGGGLLCVILVAQQDECWLRE